MKKLVDDMPAMDVRTFAQAVDDIVTAPSGTLSEVTSTWLQAT